MTRLILADSRPTRLSPAPPQSGPPGERRMLGSLPIEGHDRGITFEADLVAQLPTLRRYAYELTHDQEQAMDLVQDTCEKALRFRRLFREGTSMRAWVLTIMPSCAIISLTHVGRGQTRWQAVDACSRNFPSGLIAALVPIRSAL